MEAKKCIEIFNRAIDDYHVSDHIDAKIINPFQQESFEAILYQKCWIDTVQWHMEDLIRSPNIDSDKGMSLKRRIDLSNQERTDTVENLDDYFYNEFRDQGHENSSWNTESPGWVLDKLSILCLKIFHMKEQTKRGDVTKEHIEICQHKLNVLLQQQKDLSISYHELLEDYKIGKKVIKLYRQMKMYNDKNLNPELYKNSSTS